MRRYILGGLVGLAAWLGTGLVAHAQSDVNGTHPANVYVSDNISIYKATVTTDNKFVFTLRVRLDGVQKYYSRTHVWTSGPSYQFTKFIFGMSNWGMAVGDQLDYHGLADGSQGTPEDHHYVTVEEDPITMERGASPSRLEAEPLADRFRGILA